MLLCVCPELAEIVEECLMDAFVAEDVMAEKLSNSIRTETISLMKEIEAVESAKEKQEIHVLI